MEEEDAHLAPGLAAAPVGEGIEPLLAPAGRPAAWLAQVGHHLLAEAIQARLDQAVDLGQALPVPLHLLLGVGEAWAQVQAVVPKGGGVLALQELPGGLE